MQPEFSEFYLRAHWWSTQKDQHVSTSHPARHLLRRLSAKQARCPHLPRDSKCQQVYSHSRSCKQVCIKAPAHLFEKRSMAWSQPILTQQWRQFYMRPESWVEPVAAVAGSSFRWPEAWLWTQAYRVRITYALEWDKFVAGHAMLRADGASYLVQGPRLLWGLALSRLWRLRLWPSSRVSMSCYHSSELVCLDATNKLVVLDADLPPKCESIWRISATENGSTTARFLTY